MQVFSFRHLAGASAALALCISSTGAVAATSSAAQLRGTLSPLVALSALASDASRNALCGAVAAAAAGAAAAAQATPGCVLPLTDAAAGPPPATTEAMPPPATAEAMPPPPIAPPTVAPMGGGFGVSPLLLGLVGVAAAAVLAVLLLKKKNNDSSPT
jgi:hypothetical protein